MPPVHDILTQLATIAAKYPWLATAWHLYFGAIAVALLCGWRPSRRLGGMLSVPPLLSVSAMAWIAGNPFNGISFLFVGVLLLLLSWKLSCAPVRIAQAGFLFPGLALFAFGWAYPHFLAVSSFVPYLYRAPVGLIPCPTLAIVIGLILVLDGLGSRAICLALGVAGLLYGAFGAFRLGVALDWTLLLGALLILTRALIRHGAAARGAK